MDAPSLRRNRDFMLLWSGQAVSELGTRAAEIALPLLVLALTNSPAKAGLVGFMSGLPYLLLGVPAGALADRWDRKRLMLLSDGARCAAALSLPIAIGVHALTFVQILIVAFVIGAFSALASPAEFGALRHLVASEQIPAAISQNEARVYAAQLSGPPLGGLLFGLSRAFPFLADAVSYTASFFMLLLIRRPFQEERSTPATHIGRDIVEGVQWIWRQPFIRGAVLLAGAGNFISNGLALMIIVIARERGASSAEIGLIFTLGAIGGLIGAGVAPKLQRRIPPGVGIVGYQALWAVLIPLFLFVPPIVFGLLFAVMLLGAPTLNAIFGVYDFALIPDRLMGRVNSAASVLTAGASPIARLSAGLLLAAFGGNGTIEVWIVLATCVLFATVLSRGLRNPPDLNDLRQTAI
jgi:MFS family permease